MGIPIPPTTNMALKNHVRYFRPKNACPKVSILEFSCGTTRENTKITRNVILAGAEGVYPYGLVRV
jgi:hypothetical protein